MMCVLNKIKNVIYGVVICLTLPKVSVAQTSIDSLVNQLQAVTQQDAIPGFGVAIINNNQVLFAKGFGYADIKSKTPYTIHTFQPIASISKTLVAVALMKAQELKKLKLDDEINQYLPFPIIHPRFPAKPITIRHLANHSSGLKDTPQYYKTYVFDEKLPNNFHKSFKNLIERIFIKKYVKYFNSHPELIPKEQFLKNLFSKEGQWYRKKNFTKKSPGEAYLYCNHNATLAAMIIEKACGVSFTNFVRQHIFVPLKMKKSHWWIEKSTPVERATLYFNQYPLPNYRSSLYPDGGLVTNIDEFSRYWLAMRQAYAKKQFQILTPASFEEMYRKQTNCGIFWDIYKKAIGHDGEDSGITTYAHFGKSEDSGFIIFVNASHTKGLEKGVNQISRLLRKCWKVLNASKKNK